MNLAFSRYSIKYNVLALNYKIRVYPIYEIDSIILFKSSINDFAIKKHGSVNSIIDISTGNILWKHVDDIFLVLNDIVVRYFFASTTFSRARTTKTVYFLFRCVYGSVAVLSFT